jgi:hypothetical protein
LRPPLFSVSPRRVASSHPFSFRPLLCQHYLLAKGTDGRVILATPEDRSNQCFWGQIFSHLHSQYPPLFLPRRVSCYCVLRRVLPRPAVMAYGRCFFSYALQNSPNTPCPVSIWGILNVSGVPFLFLHSSQLGSTSHTARCGLVRVFSSSHACQRLHIFSCISPKSTCLGVSSGPSCCIILLHSYLSLSARACSSRGEGMQPGRSLMCTTPSCIL